MPFPPPTKFEFLGIVDDFFLGHIERECEYFLDIFNAGVTSVNHKSQVLDFLHKIERFILLRVAFSEG